MSGEPPLLNMFNEEPFAGVINVNLDFFKKCSLNVKKKIKNFISLLGSIKNY